VLLHSGMCSLMCGKGAYSIWRHIEIWRNKVTAMYTPMHTLRWVDLSYMGNNDATRSRIIILYLYYHVNIYISNNNSINPFLIYIPSWVFEQIRLAMKLLSTRYTAALKGIISLASWSDVRQNCHRLITRSLWERNTLHIYMCILFITNWN
jgi:hypothetical protein